MLSLSLIATVFLFGSLTRAIDSDNGTWLFSYPIRSGLPKWSSGRHIEGISNDILYIYNLITNWRKQFGRYEMLSQSCTIQQSVAIKILPA